MSLDVYSLGATGPAILVGLFLLPVALVVVAAMTAHRRRRRALAAWAQAMKLSCEHSLPGGSASADVFLAQFGPSGMLDDFRIVSVHNIIRGWTKGHSWLIFDLHGWREHLHRESSAAQWTVMVLLTAESFPTLRIEPVVALVSRLNPNRSLATPTGYEEFDRRFMVFGDPESLGRVLTPALRDHLLQLAGAPNRWYRHLFMHRNMIALVEVTLAPPRRIGDMMALAMVIREQITTPVEGH